MRKLIVVFLISIISFALMIHLLGEQYQQVSFREAEQKLCNIKKGEVLLPADLQHFPLTYVCGTQTGKRKFVPEKVSLHQLDGLCLKGEVLTYVQDAFFCREEIIVEGRFSFPVAIL
jgi:hypothetical protein